MAFNLWKQLKKRIRRGRRPLWSLGGLAFWLAAVSAVVATLYGASPATAHAAVAAAAYSDAERSADQPSHAAVAVAAYSDAERSAGQPSLAATLDELRRDGGTAEVTLHRIYVCGEETEPLGRLQAGQIAALLREHSDWSAMMEADGRTVRIEQRINDLSSHCKTNAYFGIDRVGNFSLYDGRPKDEKVMRTFFQLDIQYLESSLPQEELDHLSRGIRVSDIDEYNSVLSTFSDYALEDGRQEDNAHKPF